MPGAESVTMVSNDAVMIMAVLVKLNLFAIKLGRGEIETLASSVMFAADA